ncbi:MAG: hypothetical protein PHY45_15985 [Rhodocyclaceae bacterium]|nr:hypothetical protein [Rhodocyclaceae bacterium]
METIEFSKSDLRRLQKLAAAAGRSEKSMLKYVLRDGFEYCECVVKAVNEGIADAAAGRVVPSGDVRSRARQVIAANARKQAA